MTTSKFNNVKLYEKKLFEKSCFKYGGRELERAREHGSINDEPWTFREKERD